MTPSRPADPSRRLLLLGVVGVPVAAVVLPAVAAPAPAAEPEPECLADLIGSGVVTRADLVAR